MLMLLSMLACAPSRLEDGVYAVSGAANTTRSDGLMVLAGAEWTFHDLGDGAWSIQLYDGDGAWMWGTETAAPDEDGVFDLSIDQVPACDESDVPGYHELQIRPEGSPGFVSRGFEGLWDLWQQQHDCSGERCLCTGPEIERTWALDLTGYWDREIPEGF